MASGYGDLALSLRSEPELERSRLAVGSARQNQVGWPGLWHVDGDIAEL
jgi:hypothetical protein